MNALILSGGQGTRLRPLTLYSPKPLLPIANAPFLSYPMALLRQHQTRRVTLCTSDALAPYQSFIRDQKRLKTDVVCSRETRPLGTAGAIKNAERFVDESPFFVFNGDILTDVNLTEMARFHHDKGALVTIALIQVKNPASYGLIQAARDGRIKKFIEKPSPKEMKGGREFLINSGIYLFDKSVFSRIPAGRAYSAERELFPDLLKRGLPFFGYRAPHSTYWLDIGTADRYVQANADAVSGRLSRTIPFAKPSGKGAGSVVLSGAKVSTDSVIGRGCRVGTGSILNRCVLLDHVTIENDVVLENCVVGSRSFIGHHSTVRGAAVGNHSVLTPYTKL